MIDDSPKIYRPRAKFDFARKLKEAVATWLLLGKLDCAGRIRQSGLR
jgi:hypothetical protein